MLFLGEALTTMIVYIGCRRNPFVVYNFFGLFRFQAPYLPWILVLFSVLFGGSVAVDLVGESLSLCVLMWLNTYWASIMHDKMRRRKSNSWKGRAEPASTVHYNTHEKACETTTFVLSAQPEISIGLSVLWVSVRVMRSYSSAFYHPLLIDVNSGLNFKSQLNSCLSRVAISLSLFLQYCRYSNRSHVLLPWRRVPQQTWWI